MASLQSATGNNAISTTCCVVGGGPAGMMLGYLLARAGIDVTVLEKHADFLRDFRGDTVHPSTLQVLEELGLAKEFLRRPHDELTEIGAQIEDTTVTLADFSQLPTKHKFIVFMPQWDFLDFLSVQARRFPSFRLLMNTEATRVIEDESGRITGVIARNADGELTIEARQVFGTDGRSSVIREAAGLTIEDIGAPMDVLWMRLSKKDTDPPQTLGRVKAGSFFIMLNRNDYWQCAYVIPKGQIDVLKQEGIEAFRERIVHIAPHVKDRVAELESWNDVKLLTVKVDRLNKWYRDGLLCIGDAAHAMSPVAGVGINLAIQDAVATANLLYEPLLKNGMCSEHDLKRVQDRRMYPTRMTQAIQVMIQNNVIVPTLQSTEELSAPWPMRLLDHFPMLRRFPAQLIGMGFRPEHIHIPSASRATKTQDKIEA